MGPALAGSLNTAVEPWLSRRDGKSGVIPLADGETALGARLRMIEGAERSIDVQYFLIKPDTSAVLIVESLIEAAKRGVRIRILLDDVFTTAPDDGLVRLDSISGIEVRLYNPVARPGPSWLNFLARFPASNRRMHNKSFTVDGIASIVGGRNIADEYYSIEQAIEFADFDVAVIGPAAQEISQTFDEFWNSRLSVPVTALVGEEAARSAIARDFTEPDSESIARARAIYDEAVDTPFLQDLEAGRIEPLYGRIRAISDPPAKLGYPVGSGLDVLYREIRDEIAWAKSEVLIVSPYFVPKRERVALLSEAAARGVRVVVITNSLASNNHPYVHGGYYPYRREMLRAGIEIYEAKVDTGLTRVDGETAQLTLHTKAVIIDRQVSYIGSLNMDPRSIDINSEMKLRIDSEEFATLFAEAVARELPPHVYALSINAEDELIWTYGFGADANVTNREPDASGWCKIACNNDPLGGDFRVQS